jgi:hypothetical protein
MASRSRRSTDRNGRTESQKVPDTKDDKEQSARFIEAARELEADESGEEFRLAVDRILTTKKP